MIPEEIIKALRICSNGKNEDGSCTCHDCPYFCRECNAGEDVMTDAAELIETLQKMVDAEQRARQDMTCRAMDAEAKIASLKKTTRARAVKHGDDETIFEYDNVLEITAYTAKDMGYCKRLWLDDGRAVDFWASDWSVQQLGWVEV